MLYIALFIRHSLGGGELWGRLTEVRYGGGKVDEVSCPGTPRQRT